MRAGSALLPLALLLLLGSIWGGGTSVHKFISVSGVAPMAAVFWQSFGATVTLLLICAVRRSPVGLTPRHLAYYVIVGSLGFALPNVNMLFVLREIPAGTMAVVLTSAPLLTYLIALAMRYESVVPIRAFGVASGFIGALLLVLPESSLPAPEARPFAVLALFTPATYVIANLYAERRRPQTGDPLTNAAGMLLFSTPFLLVLNLGTGTFHPIWADFGAAEAAMLAYSVLTAGALVLFFAIVRLSGAVYLSQVGYIISVVGLLVGMVTFGERPSPLMYAAVALIFAGVAMVNSRKAPPAPAAQSAQ